MAVASFGGKASVKKASFKASAKTQQSRQQTRNQGRQGGTPPPRYDSAQVLYALNIQKQQQAQQQAWKAYADRMNAQKAQYDMQRLASQQQQSYQQQAQLRQQQAARTRSRAAQFGAEGPAAPVTYQDDAMTWAQYQQANGFDPRVTNPYSPTAAWQYQVDPYEAGWLSMAMYKDKHPNYGRTPIKSATTPIIDYGGGGYGNDDWGGWGDGGGGGGGTWTEKPPEWYETMTNWSFSS